MSKVYVVLGSGAEYISDGGSRYTNELEGVYSNIDAAKEHLRAVYEHWVEENDEDADIEINKDCTIIRSEDGWGDIELGIREIELRDMFVKFDGLKDGCPGYLN